MSDKALSWLFVVMIGLAVTGAIGGYYYGNRQGDKKGYSRGYTDGKLVDYENPTHATDVNFAAEQNYVNLTNQYNQLVSDYNALRNNVIEYVGRTNYQAKQPITCNSSTWGISSQYTTTNCY